MTVARADTVVLCDGASDSAHLPSSGNQIGFTDAQAVQRKFRVPDLPSIVFTGIADIVALRNGKKCIPVNTWDLNRSASAMAKGIQYPFPLRDVETIVFVKDTVTTMSGTIVAKVMRRAV